MPKTRIKIRCTDSKEIIRSPKGHRRIGGSVRLAKITTAIECEII